MHRQSPHSLSHLPATHLPHTFGGTAQAHVLLLLHVQAIVEYVLSGHRLKLLVPKEGTALVFAPSGIKTPQRAQAAGMGRPAVAVCIGGGGAHGKGPVAACWVYVSALHTAAACMRTRMLHTALEGSVRRETLA